MAKPLLTPLPDLPAWREFKQRFAFDLNAFSIAVCGRIPTPQQEALFYSVEESGSRTSVSSGHGTGKTGAIGVIALWHLLCFPKSNTIITAPRITQVKNQAWKEIADMKMAMLKGAFAWLAEYIVLDAERVYIKGFKQSWYVIPKTAPKGAPENLAGEHRDWLLWIIDEASGVPDEHFGVMTGALSDKRNRMLLTSQPTRPSGFFYDTHHRLNKRNGGVWNALVFNSEHSPLVSEEFIAEKRIQYTKSMYDIKVRGRFPDKTDGFLLGRSDVERQFTHAAVVTDHDKWGWMLGCDVGGGDYRDWSVLVKAKVTGYGDYGPDARRVHIDSIPIYSNGIDGMRLAGDVRHYMTHAGILTDTLLIDAVAYGSIPAKNLIENGAAGLVRVEWGDPCYKEENKDNFINVRAQCIVGAARAIQDGRLTLNPDIPYRNQILDEASRIPFFYDERGRYHIVPKPEMRKMGISSPDIWDAICFLFIDGTYYNINFKNEMLITTSKRDVALQKARADMAGIPD